MSNKKTATKEAPSLESRRARTQARKTANRERNEAQNAANVAYLRDRGISHPSKSYDRVIRVEIKKGREVNVIERTITKYYTPSKLRRQHERSIDALR